MLQPLRRRIEVVPLLQDFSGWVIEEPHAFVSLSWNRQCHCQDDRQRNAERNRILSTRGRHSNLIRVRCLESEYPRSPNPGNDAFCSQPLNWTPPFFNCSSGLELRL